MRQFAPATVVWAAGGTRRHAALTGRAVDEAYYEWAWQEQLRLAKLFFDLGVRVLFMPGLGPPQVREVGPYRERLVATIKRLGSQASLHAYHQMNVRVRFYGQQHMPELVSMCSEVEAATRDLGPQVLWWSFVVEHSEEALWDAMRAAIGARATSLQEARLAFYGEDVAPVDVFIGFGKLQAGYLMPPLLGEQADLYWTAFPSYMLTEQHLRTIFWDHRFARQTWTADKTERYEGIERTGLAKRYGESLVLGVGERVGSFWYPMLSPGEGAPGSET
jgi:hypothetical protein